MNQPQTMNQQQQNCYLKTDSSENNWGGGGGLNQFYWPPLWTYINFTVQIFALEMFNTKLVQLAWKSPNLCIV